MKTKNLNALKQKIFDRIHSLKELLKDTSDEIEARILKAQIEELNELVAEFR